MKNTVRFNTPYEDEEPRRDEGRNGYAISGNHRNGAGYGSSQRPFQNLIFVLYGLNEYQKQRLENKIFQQGGSVSSMISERVKFIFEFFFRIRPNIFVDLLRISLCVLI